MKTITQSQYDVLHPYLPVQRGNVSISNLTLINAVLCIVENGCKWRSLPPAFGNGNTVYVRIRKWAENGVLGRLFEALQAHNIMGMSVDRMSLDSTSIKVHPDGMGALKKTARHASANQAVDGQPKCIWCPRMTDRLKGFRRICSRFEKLDIMFKAFIIEMISVNTP